MTIAIHHSKIEPTRNSSATTLSSPTARKLVLVGSGTWAPRSIAAPTSTATTRIATSSRSPGPPQDDVPFTAEQRRSEPAVAATISAPTNRPVSTAAGRPRNQGSRGVLGTDGGSDGGSGCVATA